MSISRSAAHVPTPLPGVAITQVSLSELLAALSHALDLTEGSPPGHTLRSCILGMRIAESLALREEDRAALYYATLLKDSGCSSNAARVTALFGTDDRAVKPRMKSMEDRGTWSRLRAMMALTAPGRSLVTRMRYLIGMRTPSAVTRELMKIRCDRGSAIARGLGFPGPTADAIAALDEHWNGGGYPRALAGDAIPLIARIVAVAQTVDIFLMQDGPAAAIRVLRDRRGTWFDPAVANVVLQWQSEHTWWRSLRGSDPDPMVRSLAPRTLSHAVSDEGIDLVAQSFADIIDAKSPYTYRHSSNVARYAVGIGEQFTRDPLELRRLRRAALLHDIGKLGVSNSVLDKNGPLTAEERLAVQLHPQHTWDILSRVTAFQDFAMLAAVHHEKLDGSGYPWGFTDEQLGTFERTLTVADIYEALTAHRPYRAGMPRDEAFAILDRERGDRLWGPAIDALRASLPPADGDRVT